MWDPLLSPSASGGVTTVVMGNCGVGAAPCRKEDRDFMVHLLEGVGHPGRKQRCRGPVGGQRRRGGDLH